MVVCDLASGEEDADRADFYCDAPEPHASRSEALAEARWDRRSNRRRPCPPTTLRGAQGVRAAHRRPQVAGRHLARASAQTSDAGPVVRAELSQAALDGAEVER